ncbi:MAG: DUF2299 family protein [Candidatus Thorarchaeota archaeon]
MSNVANNGIKLKSIIRKYLNVDCTFLKKVEDPNYDFGFEVKYPKIKDVKGKSKGRYLVILKPKKKYFLRIINNIQLDEEGTKIYNELDVDKKNLLIDEIRNFLILQNLLQTFNKDNLRITFLDKLYFSNSDFPSINDLYHSIMKVINAQIIVMNILTARLSIKNINQDDLNFENSYFQ